MIHATHDDATAGRRRRRRSQARASLNSNSLVHVGAVFSTGIIDTHIQDWVTGFGSVRFQVFKPTLSPHKLSQAKPRLHIARPARNFYGGKSAADLYSSRFYTAGRKSGIIMEAI